MSLSSFAADTFDVRNRSLNGGGGVAADRVRGTSKTERGPVSGLGGAEDVTRRCLFGGVLLTCSRERKVLSRVEKLRDVAGE